MQIVNCTDYVQGKPVYAQRACVCACIPYECVYGTLIGM